MSLVVPCDNDVAMTAFSHVTHRCPFVDEIDNGHIKIAWRVAGATFELHALREYLSGFKDAQMSHEAITDRIQHDLSVTPGVEAVTVETTWHTAGMEVRCSTSPTLAETL